MDKNKPTKTDSNSPDKVKVWDPVVRLFHWTTVICFTGSYFFEKPRDLHETLGWIVVAALVIRILWGFIGTPHARFTDFVPSPLKFFSYVRDSFKGKEQRFLGHNPAGGAMVIALMIMLAAIATTGWMMGLDQYFGEQWVEDLHESAVNLTLVLIFLHVGGVIWESIRHRENLIKAMFTGFKRR